MRTDPKAFKIAQRREIVSRHYLSGMTQADIAERVGVDQATVSRDIEAVQSAWRESGIRNFDEHKAGALATIDRQERWAYAAWFRSRGRMRKKTTSTKWFEGVEREEVSVVEWMEAGDPQFLKVIDSCIDKRCKILGLYAPLKTENKHEITNDAPDELIEQISRMGYTPPAQRVPRFQSNGHANGFNGHNGNGHDLGSNGNGHASAN